jgi:outer membrane receptor for ferrienterochelin and colicins
VCVAQVGIVNGFITDIDTHKPVSGASIQIDSLLLGVNSETDGHFSIPKVPEGIYRLTVSCIGYKTNKQQIKVSNNGLTLNIVLQTTLEELQEVVVTGTGTEHYTKNAPVQTEVISGKVLKEFAGRDIEDVLGSLSSSITYNRSDMGSNLKINGLKNDYILILIDGKRMNGDVGGQNDLSRINMSNIERIEVVKGAVSSLYGSDAIGGVINFISKKSKDKLKVSTQTRLGEYGDISQGNSINLSHNKWNSATSFDYKHTDGWQNTSKEWYRNNLYENIV